MNTAAIAKTLAHLHLNASDERINPRPIDRKVAAAQAQGAYKVANAVGYGFTETHVETTTIETHRAITAQHGPRPLYSATNNSARKAWDKAFIEALTAALDEIA